MSLTPQELVVAEKKVVGVLNQWSGEGFFRLKGLGERIRIENIQNLSAYTVSVKTQYEDRNVTPAHEPYRGGEIDNMGEPPDPF